MVPTAPKRLFSEEPVDYRQLIQVQSSDSQNGSSSEWIRPDSYKAFPRPASRNVIQIDHGSGILGVLPDSLSTPVSSDDQKPPSRGNVTQIQVLPIQDRCSNNSGSRAGTVISTRPNTNDTSSDDYISSASPPKRDVNSAILTNTINTGSEFR